MQLKAAKSAGDKNKAKDLEAKAKKDAQKKGSKKGARQGMDAAEDVVTTAPRKWHDYTVSFAFPEPTELQPPLIQLTDVDFKYPGETRNGV